MVHAEVFATVFAADHIVDVDLFTAVVTEAALAEVFGFVADLTLRLFLASANLALALGCFFIAHVVAPCVDLS